MNPYNDQIEPLPDAFNRIPAAPATAPMTNYQDLSVKKAPYHDIFVLPPVGTRVAAFGGYHWKIKSVNTETQEVVLEQDSLTAHGEIVKASLK